MIQKEYIPLIYVVVYYRLKEKAMGDTVDKSEFERCLSNNPFKFSKFLRPIILFDMKRYGLLQYNHGDNSGKIKLMPINIAVDLTSTSSMMHYAGCW